MSEFATHQARYTAQLLNLSRSALDVLLVLAECLNDDNGQCNPSRELIMARGRLSRRSLASGMGELESLGVVETTKNKKGGSNLNAERALHLPKAKRYTDPCSNCIEKAKPLLAKIQEIKPPPKLWQSFVVEHQCECMLSKEERKVTHERYQTNAPNVTDVSPELSRTVLKRGRQLSSNEDGNCPQTRTATVLKRGHERNKEKDFKKGMMEGNKGEYEGDSNFAPHKLSVAALDLEAARFGSEKSEQVTTAETMAESQDCAQEPCKGMREPEGWELKTDTQEQPEEAQADTRGRSGGMFDVADVIEAVTPQSTFDQAGIELGGDITPCIEAKPVKAIDYASDEKRKGMCEAVAKHVLQVGIGNRLAGYGHIQQIDVNHASRLLGTTSIRRSQVADSFAGFHLSEQEGGSLKSPIDAVISHLEKLSS